MTYRSVNGWIASPNPALIGVARHTVPGTGGKTTLTIKSGPVASILLYVARRFNKEVDALPERVLDDWGYNFRPIRTGTSISNHGSGTAIDLNATDYPMGRRNMSAEQRAAVRRILHACGGVVRWGGDFQNYPDEMHFEIAPGVTPAQVSAQVKKMRLRRDGTVTPLPLPWWKRPKIVVPAFTSPIRLGSTGHPVEAVQFALGLPVTGKAGAATIAAIKAFQKPRPWLWPADGVAGPKTYAAITKRINA